MTGNETAPNPSSELSHSRDSRLSRRRLFGLTSAGVALAGAGVAVGTAARSPSGSPSGDAATSAVAFHGEHQTGIITPAQDRVHFVALDVVTTDRTQVVDLLKTWTRAAERMTAGAEMTGIGALGGNPDAPPEDNGEALGLPPSQLTLTLGLGGSLFDGRFGLADRKPAALADLPHFQADMLDPARCGGDLCIQACANDPQVAVHAIRHLVRLGIGATAVRWSQLGFGRTSSTSTSQATPRNLFGFKDGTNNIKAEDSEALRQFVWVPQGEEPGWLAGGSYLVVRRISMRIERWDRTSLNEQEATIGRVKGSGAPLGKQGEFDVADFTLPGGDKGGPLIGDDAHIRLASAQANGEIRFLRRGYNFVDGTNGNGHLDAGLFFLAYMRDPQRQYVPVQRVLSRSDRMREYIDHTGSALFAIPPGVRPGGFWADTLFT
ncbi:MAG: deferrochelatase/peroxidase EfeB [Pseudonocardia sp.]|nr:deferrochelatase/peroxidase EfeB [Pseudonocardia sp.]